MYRTTIVCATTLLGVGLAASYMTLPPSPLEVVSLAATYQAGVPKEISPEFSHNIIHGTSHGISQSASQDASHGISARVSASARDEAFAVQKYVQPVKTEGRQGKKPAGEPLRRACHAQLIPAQTTRAWPAANLLPVAMTGLGAGKTIPAGAPETGHAIVGAAASR